MTGRSTELCVATLSALALFLGCTSPYPLPEAPAPEPGTFRVGVIGWSGDSARMWIPPVGDAANLAEAGSIHLLDVDFDPRNLWDDRLPPATFTPIILTSTGGIRLPIRNAYHLDANDGDPVFTKQSLSAFGVDRHGLPSPQDLHTCSAVGACFEDGLCTRTDCRLPQIDPPMMPSRDCPTDWVDTATGTDVLCFPQDWVQDNEIVLPVIDAACPRGQADFGRGCEALQECGAGPFAPIPSDAALVLYVDPLASAPGEGTLAAPYKNIVSAWRDGASVMLAAGVHSGVDDLDLKDVTHVVGRCPELTELQTRLHSTESGSKLLSGLSIRSTRPIDALAGDIEASGLALYGSDLAFGLSGASLVASRCLFARTVAPGVSEEFAVVLENARFEMSESFVLERLKAKGSTVSLSRSIIFEDEPLVTDGGSPAAVDLKESVATLDDVQVFAWPGTGVRLSDENADGTRSRFTATNLRIAVSDNSPAIWMHVTAAPIRMNRVASTWRPGAARDDGKTGEGIKITHAVAEITDFATQGTHRGVVIEGHDNGTDRLRTSLTVNRAWISWLGDVGISARLRIENFKLSNVWLIGGGEVLNLDQSWAAIYQRAGVGQLDRVFIRPGGRFAISVESGESYFSDIEVAGPHGRSLWLARGVAGKIQRLRAADGGRGAVVGFNYNEPSLQMRVEHVDLRIDSDLVNLLPNEAGLEIGLSAGAWSNFAIRGLGRARVTNVGHVFKDGLITAAADSLDWPPEFLGMLSGVVVRRTPVGSGN